MSDALSLRAAQRRSNRHLAFWGLLRRLLQLRDKIGRSVQDAPRNDIRPYPRSSAVVCVLEFLLLTACQPATEPAAITMLPLNLVEGGIVNVSFDARTVLLDRRAAPYLTITLNDSSEIFGGDQKPISLLDLHAGDVVRVEGRATGNDAFLAQRLTLLRATPRTVSTATPSVVPLLSPTASALPLIPAADRIPLPGTVLIADNGNNRIIEVNADKRIVWEFSSTQNAFPRFDVPSDAFFVPGEKTIISTIEQHHQVVEIDYASRRIVWSAGEWDAAGSDDQHLNTPSDARRLPDRRTIVSDSRNCRVAIIAPDKRIAGQIGKTGDCRSLFRPIGSTPLANGRLLVTESGNRRVSEIDLQGKVWRAITLPILYPSGAQLTRAGNILVAAYDKPGRIVEVDWSGQIVWEYFPKNENERLDRPSIALELPNGNIVFTDDWNHRVAIVNRAGKILWQYGVMDVAGRAPGYLNTPNGLDFRFVPVSAATLTAVATVAQPAPRLTPTVTPTP